MTSAPTVQLALPWRARCGEGPVWDPQRAAVHWVDIPAGQIHTTTMRDLATETITVPTMVGAAAPCRSGGFVAAVTEGFAHVVEAAALEVRLPVLTDGHRMNDAKCDSRGRLWAGSTELGFAPGEGVLWVLDESWHAHPVLDGLTLPNGMGWSPDGGTFYLADTVEREIYAFDFDSAAGTLARRRRFASFPDQNEGAPDGLCVDSEGCLWVAMWGGGRIIRLGPDGRELTTVRMPVTQPSSCAFIGPALSELWITSARDGLDLGADDPQPDGSIFSLAGTGATGLPSTPFAG